MIKIMFSWKNNPDLSPEQCEAHYRAVHMQLAHAAFDGAPGFVRLTYNRVRTHRVNDFNQPDSRPETPDFDAFIELYFESRALLDRAMQHPALSEMFADHHNFMAVDVPSNIRIYDLDEEIVLSRD